MRPKSGWTKNFFPQTNVDYYLKMRHGSTETSLVRSAPADHCTSYGKPTRNVRENSSALPALIATYDERLHKVLLRQPTDFRRQINACQYLFEVGHLQKGARILNFA